MRRIAAMLVLLCAACRPGLDEERAAELQTLCEEYCPLRIECVPDGWAKGDVADCTKMCVHEERYLLANECGEASYALLECMAALPCEALPAAVVGLVGDGSGECHAEEVAQHEACTFQIIR